MLPPVFGVLFDGIAYGMLLFVLSVGLSVTLGLMNFVNLAHCAFAMLGGYVTVTLINELHWPFLATLPAAFAAAALASVALERVLYRRLYRASDLDQVLLTIGLAFISVAVAAYIFGTLQQPIETPAFLRGSTTLLGIGLGNYRLFLIGVALVVTLLLIAGLDYTRFGAQVRAAVDNQRMARGLGIDVDRTFAVTFALGSGLAGPRRRAGHRDRRARPQFLVHLPGLCPDHRLGRRPRLDRRIVRRRLLIGVSDIAGKYYVPELGAFLIYLVMVAVLMWRPAGLFGKR